MSIKTIALDTCPAAEAPAAGPAAAAVPGGSGSGMIAGGSRAVVEALAAAAPDGVLGLVVDTTGSTYSKLGGAICISGASGRVGWISGGCLESSLEQEAFALRDAGLAGFTEFDTRSDADLMFGSRIGCRGLVRIALLPMAALPGVGEVFAAWTRQAVDVEFEFSADGEVCAAAGGERRCWSVPWRDLQLPMPEFRVRLPRAPRLLVFGAGPEAELLLPWMRQLGWYVSLVERRTRWTPQLALADVRQETMPSAALSRLGGLHHDAAIVMNHDFELDREALEGLAETPVPWIGVLGPARRRDDLLRLVGPSRTRALRPRLHAPVGLPLGGRGPEAISLAIAAELHAHWNGVQAAVPAGDAALTAAT